MSETVNKIADQFDPIELCDKCGSGMCFCKSTTLIDTNPLKNKAMSEKTEYPELRKELNRLVELQQQNQLTNEADNLIKELQLVLVNPSPALQDAVKECKLKRCDCEDCDPVEIKVCTNCDGYVE